DVDGTRVVIAVQNVTFFESNFFHIVEGAPPQRITLPAKSTIQGVHKGFLIFTLEQAWNGFPVGALLAYPLDDMSAQSPHITQLYAPGPRESIESVSTTRDAILVAGYQNVRGHILRFAYDGRGWVQTDVAMPPNGSVGIAGASPSDG